MNNENGFDVYRAISEVTAELAKEGISKSRKNQAQGYSFRGIDDCMTAISPMLSPAGLCILPRMVERQVREMPSKNGGLLFYTTVTAEFDFVSVKDGSKHIVRTYGEAMDSGDKSTNKAMSAAYKYAVMQAFCIPTEGDNDTENSSPEPVGIKTDTAIQAKQAKPKAQAAGAAAKPTVSAGATEKASALRDELLKVDGVTPDAIKQYYVGCFGDPAKQRSATPDNYVPMMEDLLEQFKAGQSFVDKFKEDPEKYGKVWLTNQG